MNKNEKLGVVYTAISGDYDKLPEHGVKAPEFDYVCFSDSVSDFESVENGWDIRPNIFHHKDSVRVARYHKLNPHKLFPEYEYSMWIDANWDVKSSHFVNILRECVSRRSLLSVVPHPSRDCVYDEAEACLGLRNDFARDIVRTVKFLKEENFPENYGLFDTSILFRRHNQYQVIRVMDLWCEVLSKYSRRDQLSFPFAIRQENIACDLLFGAPDQIHRFLNEDYESRPHRKQYPKRGSLSKISYYQLESLLRFLKKFLRAIVRK